MTRDIWSPSRRRSWHERHPVLSETLSMIACVLGLCGLIYLALLVVT